MRERFFPGVVSGERKGILPALLRGLLRVLSLFYCLGLWIRKAAYALRLKRRRRLGVPVISVGNITAGGTGKTPLVAVLARMLKQAGRTPVILSRGYKGSGGGNDEAAVLSAAVPDVAHLQGKDRVAAGRKAVEEHGATCVILDDGFQHYRLERDVDIVTIDALNPLGYGRLLPRGLLREPIGALRRADAFVVTRADQVPAEKLRLLTEFLAKQAPGAVTATSRHSVTGLVRIPDGAKKEPGSLKGKKVLAFCGIGNPRSFQVTLKALGATPKLFIGFKDHQHYAGFLLNRIDKAAVKLDVDAICTTEKDAVKIGDFQWEKPCYVVKVALEFIEGGKAVEDLVFSAVEKEHAAREVQAG